MDLYQKVRPKELSELVGQPEVVQILKEKLANGNMPHVTLLVGPSGCGKTTAARIIRDKLGCVGGDYKEINCATVESPLNSVRLMEQQTNMAAGFGKVRVWYLDECFASHTLVKTISGYKQIDQIKTGDLIPTITGVGRVQKIFVNRVKLHRVVRLRFTDGTTIFTTAQHEFLTKYGWIPAGQLQSSIPILCDTCYPITHEQANRLPSLQKEFCSQAPLQQTQVLLQDLRGFLEGGSEGTGENRATILSVLHKDIHSAGSFQKEVLLRSMWKQLSDKSEQTKTIQVRQRRPSEEILRISKEISCNYTWTPTAESNFPTYENKQSFLKSGRSQENKKDQDKKGNSECLDGRSWGEWSTYTTTGTSLEIVGGTESGMVYGTSNFVRFKEGRIPNKLQSGYWKPPKESGHRNRWTWPRMEEETQERSEKAKVPHEVRLEGIEIYQPGSERTSFHGIVTDNDVRRGYIEFLDLQVSGHPSYFVEGGIPVHNCQALSRAGFAQQGLLKTLEDVPDHVYFLLATTDPVKIIPTIQTRCTILKFRLIPAKDMRGLLGRVSKSEGWRLDEEVVERIIECAEGSARRALKLLEQVVVLKDRESQLNAVVRSDTKVQGVDLAKALLRDTISWKEIHRILQSSEDEPETIRRIVLGFAMGAMFKRPRSRGRAYHILTSFCDNVYDSGLPGLARACYEVIESARNE